MEKKQYLQEKLVRRGGWGKEGGGSRRGFGFLLIEYGLY